MSYRFKKEDTCQQNVRRIAGEQLGSSLSHLDEWTNTDEIIHDLRKRFKKLRGLLRLVRGSIDTYKEHNVLFRDAGRKLSRFRDAHVMLETLDALDESSDLQRSRVQTARRQIKAWQKKQETTEKEKLDCLETFHGFLRDALEQVRRWDLTRSGFGAIRGGLAKTYKRARDALKKACADGSRENIHEFRKRAKYHWYHIRLLQDTWPELLKPLRSQCKVLQNTLGDIHDLDVQTGALRGELGQGMETETIDELIQAASARREELRRRCSDLGRRVFAEKSQAMAERFQQLFKVWKNLTPVC